MIQKSAYIILFCTILFVTVLLYLVKQPSFQSLFVKITPTPTPTISEIIIPGSGGLKLDQLTNMAKQDLASRLSIDISQINLLKTQKKDWPDSSLGCPQPGKFYSQIVTSGYLITLEANGKSYNYHTSLEKIIFCN